MKTNQTRKIFFVLGLFFSLNLYSSSSFGDLKMMSVPEGLNNSTIYNIARDQRGFIWLSTDLGISRYDGFHFRNFPYVENTNTNLLSTHAVSKMNLDEDGLLYLQLVQGGLACFDNTKESYLTVEFNRPLGNEKINDIYIADKHVLYVATSKGLYNAEVKRTTKDKKEIIQVLLSVVPLVKGNISHLCSHEGYLFFVRDQKTVIHYFMGTRQVKVIGEGDTNAPVSFLYVDGDYLWICRKWQVPLCYNVKRENSRVLVDVNGVGGMRLSGTCITGIASIGDSSYYLSTKDGLFSLKFSSGNRTDATVSIEQITPDKHMNGYEVEAKMNDLLWDDQQNTLWIGTFGGGAIKINFNEDVYNRLLQGLNGDLNGIEEDAKGYVWLAVNRKGIWRSTTNKLSPASEFVPWTKGVSSSENYYIYKDKNGEIWLGDEHAGIIYIDPLTEETQRFQLTPAGTNNFAGNPRQLCLDSRGRLWIITDQGVVLFDTNSKSSSLVFKPNNEITDVSAIAEDKEGDIWLGTNAGLKRVELQSGVVKLTGNYEQQAGMQPDEVTAIYVNSYNQIFASYQGKVIRIDGRDKNKVEVVSTLANGLSSGHVFCMIDDNNGNTWIGTNSGIMTIRNDRTSFYDYSTMGCFNTVCRLRDGRLLWADSWGLVFFNPLTVKNHKNQSKLLLSDLWVNGKSVAVGEKVDGEVILSSTPDLQEQFIFSADNKEINFYFSDLQYGMMQRKLSYRLLPDEEWRTASLEDGICYNHLASGKYTLQVKLVYPDASEGETLEIPIVVKAYWWGTVWAFIGYIILLAGLCVTVYKYLLRKEKKKLQDIHEKIMQNEEPLQELEEQDRNLEIDEIRGIVFIRLIQEMQTPLSMIVSPLKELLQEKELSKGLSAKVLLAYRNSMGIKNACDQLLNIYGMESSVKNKVELASYSIVRLLDAFVFSMNEFLRVHPIQFQYEKKVKKDLEVWVSRKDMELVLHSLLYNAFIHIQYSGVVALIVQEIEEQDGRYCSIVVVDNGKNEVKTIEELSRDKDQLMEIDSSSVELGYSLMADIMKEHHGTVSMRNLQGEGTRVEIKWPIDKDVFEQDENVVFVESEMQEEIILPEGGALVKTMDIEEELELLTEEDTHHAERTRKTLLIVEDYSDIRLYLKTLFEREYNILMAVNGEEGVNMAKKELPDLVLCDVMMPVKDGFECCQEIKEGLDTCNIPVIMLTAKVEENDIIRGLEIGADDYILKPFNPSILKIKVKNLIEGRVNLKKMYTRLLVSPVEESPETSSNIKEAEIEDPFISIVVKIIEENMQEPDFNVKKLASDLNMSQPTLYRKVKQCTDFTIIELIRGVRMKKAATLLIKKQYPVQEVAEMVGYNDIPTFRKHFVDTYGTTPSTYADSKAKA